MESIINPQLEKYTAKIQESLKNIVYSYPFYDISDSEILNDAIKRGQNKQEFALHIAGEIEREEVPVISGSQMATRTSIALYDLIDNKKVDLLKISSFIFPYKLLGSFLLESDEIVSTINYSRINTYDHLLSVFNEKIVGKKIFVARKVAAIGKYGASSFSNISTMNENDLTANFIRNHFIQERKSFIKNMLTKPYLYFNSTVDKNNKEYCMKALKQYENELSNELKKIEKLKYS